MKKILSVSLISMACCGAISAQAGENCDGFTTEMNCFEDGNVAYANQVNANFQALLDKIAQLENRIALLEATCPSPSGCPSLPGDELADYDSGWFPVKAPQSNQVVIKEHNLNAFPTRYWIWFSPDNPPSTKIYPHGHGQFDFNGIESVQWEQPQGIAFTKNEIIYRLKGGYPMAIYTENSLETWQSGYWRILLWK